MGKSGMAKVGKRFFQIILTSTKGQKGQICPFNEPLVPHLKD